MSLRPGSGIYRVLEDLTRTSLGSIDRITKPKINMNGVSSRSRALGLSLLALLVVASLLAIGVIVYGQEPQNGNQAASAPAANSSSVSATSTQANQAPQKEEQIRSVDVQKSSPSNEAASEVKQTNRLASRIIGLKRLAAQTAQTDLGQEQKDNPVASEQTTEAKPEQKVADPTASSSVASAPQPPLPAADAKKPSPSDRVASNSGDGSNTANVAQTQDSQSTAPGSDSAAKQDVAAAGDKSVASRPQLSARSDRADDEAKAADKPADKPVEKPTDKPAEKSTGEPPDKPADKPADKPVDKPMSAEESFIDLVADGARLSEATTGVPASVTIAQAMLESDLGRSQLSKNANNFFGIKATSKPGPAGVVYMNTWESVGGKDITVQAPFRAYHDMLESFIDHARFFVENDRYASAMQNIGDPRTFAKLIQKAGYATDPKYSDKLIALMDKFNLYAYDTQP